MVVKYVAGLKALLARRAVAIVAAAAVLASLIVILVRLGPSTKLNDLKLPDLDMSKLPNIPGFSHDPAQYGRCNPMNHTEDIKEWKMAREKYDKLMEDKFT
jgi:glucuronyl/N-acetylglucosaminyl transferase EXT2/alpha-1,4-N-acetylglucosaminyltransferase EXTL3